MAKVHTSFTQIEVQILMFKKILVNILKDSGKSWSTDYTFSPPIIPPNTDKYKYN